MEEKENSSSGGGATATVSSDEAPDNYRIAPRAKNPAQLASPPAIPAPPRPENQLASPAGAISGPEAAATGKKKRGRPRKYGPDGSPVSLALSPMPISASIPLTGEFSAWKRGRGRGRSAGAVDCPVTAAKKSSKYEVFQTNSSSPGLGIAYSVGANFTPHVLNVNAGEDVTMKVMTFSQQGARAICILSANGTISNVTLRQPTSSGGTLTYEGRFEILSLSGSYMPTENAGTKSRSGGMSVSLAGPDGRVVGGGLAGLLVAAGPVQVVVGSFLPGHQQEQKAKKQRIEPITSISPPPVINAVSADDSRGGLYGGIKPMVTPAAFTLDNNSNNSNNASPLNAMQGFRNSVSDNINSNKPASLPGDETKGLGQSNCEVSC